MKQRAFLLLFLLLLPVFSLFSEEFKFQFQKGEKYRYITTVIEEVYVNDQFSHSASILNKIAVEVDDVNDGNGNISATYQVSERSALDTGSYALNEEFQSKFWLQSNGEYIIKPEYLFPLNRNIPLFPKQNIESGNFWNAQGIEVHDLRRPYNIEKPYQIPLTVNYKYLGNKTINGKIISQFEISYSFFHNMKVTPSKDTPYYPVKTAGEVALIYYWDNAAGKVSMYEEQFDIMYLLSTGDTIEFIGTARGELIVSDEFNKEQTKNDIQKELNKEKVEDVTVEKVDEGVKLTLDNIQFEPESDILLQSEKQKLDKISQILGKYPDRDLLVIGHAAKRGTVEGQIALSRSRAKSVADYLLQKGVRTSNQVITQGKGATEPVADNSTEEGRIKNRRVEIILLEN